ncbi:hypothetical protein HRE39_11640 [Enterococcus faecalis]|nr:hypothetical protein [Enterococcus faecalis]
MDNKEQEEQLLELINLCLTSRWYKRGLFSKEMFQLYQSRERLQTPLATIIKNRICDLSAEKENLTANEKEMNDKITFLNIILKLIR